MASITPHRLGSSAILSLQIATRSRSLAFSFSTVHRTRHQPRTLHHHHPRLQTSSRSFSAHFSRHAEAQASTASTTTESKPRTSTPATSTVRKPTTTTPTASTTPSSATSASRQPPPQTSRSIAVEEQRQPIREISQLSDMPPAQLDDTQVDWTRSYHGLSAEAFPREAIDILMQPLNTDDIEIKPDGIVYLPEIKYRRILNRAFGPGGWGLAPRGETIVTPKSVTREYALLAHGRLVSVARGEQDYFDSEGIPTATEGCKSNALMRCCKDLGIASELWDPRFVRKYLAQHAREVWVEHSVSKKRKKVTMRKDDEVRYPFKEVRVGG